MLQDLRTNRPGENTRKKKKNHFTLDNISTSIIYEVYLRNIPCCVFFLVGDSVMENKREDNVDEQRFVLIFTYRNLFKTRLFVFHALFFFFLYLLFDSLKRQFDFLKLLVVLHGYKSGIINFFLVSFTFSF